jgi:hypothetical protein
LGSLSTRFAPLPRAGRAFALHHEPSGRPLLFDTGIRKEEHGPSAPFLEKAVHKFDSDVHVVETTESAGENPASVDTIIWRCADVRLTTA